MQRISLKKSKFQKILDSLIFIYRLFFGIETETPKTKPYVFTSPIEERRQLEKAVRLFELKISGGAR